MGNREWQIAKKIDIYATCKQDFGNPKSKIESTIYRATKIDVGHRKKRKTRYSQPSPSALCLLPPASCHRTSKSKITSGTVSIGDDAVGHRRLTEYCFV